MPFPILFGTTVTTVLHYCADCDTYRSFLVYIDRVVVQGSMVTCVRSVRDVDL